MMSLNAVNTQATLGTCVIHHPDIGKTILFYCLFICRLYIKWHICRQIALDTWLIMVNMIMGKQHHVHPLSHLVGRYRQVYPSDSG